MALWEQLRCLADDAQPRLARERSATELYRALRHFGPSVVRRQAYSVPEVVIEEAIHKVVLEASLGRSRFRGEDERAARAWCNRILQRHAIDHFRRQRQKITLEDAPTLVASTENDLLLVQDLEQLLLQLHEALQRFHRARDLEQVQQNLKVHLEARLLGRTLDEQVESSADAPPPEDIRAWKKARDRVYQWRRRGKVAGCATLASLEETGEVSGGDADLMRRLLGCDDESDSPKPRGQGL